MARPSKGHRMDTAGPSEGHQRAIEKPKKILLPPALAEKIKSGQPEWRKDYPLTWLVIEMLEQAIINKTQGFDTCDTLGTADRGKPGPGKAGCVDEENKREAVTSKDLLNKDSENSISTGCGETTNRGKRSTGDELFDQWWELFKSLPVRAGLVAKRHSLKEWPRACKIAGGAMELIAATQRLRKHQLNIQSQGKEPLCAKAPHRWLKEQAFEEWLEDNAAPAPVVAMTSPTQMDWRQKAELDRQALENVKRQYGIAD